MTKKTKKVASVRISNALYEGFSSKIDAHDVGKAIEAKKKTHYALVAKALLGFDKPVGLNRIVTAAKAAGYDAKAADRYVRLDLAYLVREGLAKKTAAEPEDDEKPKASKAKMNTARKPRKSATKPASTSPSADEELVATPF